MATTALASCASRPSLEAILNIAPLPRAPQPRLTHLISCSPAALAVTRTLSVSRDRARSLPTSACVLVPQIDTLRWRMVSNGHINVPPAGLIEARCASRPPFFACAFHSAAASSLSRSAMHLHCKGLERRSLHVLNLACRACAFRSFGCQSSSPASTVASPQAAHSSRLLKPSTPAVCSSRLLKPPAPAVCSSAPLNLKTSTQSRPAARRRNTRRRNTHHHGVAGARRRSVVLTSHIALSALVSRRTAAPAAGAALLT